MQYYNSHEYMVQKIQQTKPLMAFEAGSDYSEWKIRAKQKLEELLGLPLETCKDNFQIRGESEEEGYRRIDFEFQSEEAYYIPCHLLIPNGSRKPLPTVICLQGHSSGQHISMGKPMFPGDENLLEGRDFAIQAVKEGYCAITMDQRYMGQAGQAVNGTPSCIIENRSMPSLLLGRTAIGERVWDVQRLMDVMEAHLQNYVDVERIICLGNSGGGTTTFYAACIDERINMAVPSCAVCTFEESIVPEYHCACNYIPGIRKYFNMSDVGCLIAPRKLIQVNGVKDHIFRIEGARECQRVIRQAYRKLGCEENYQIVEGNGGHQFYPTDVWPFVESMVVK